MHENDAKYIIDGIFLCKNITGIQRFAIEITKELDKIVEDGEIELVVPERCERTIELSNIKIIKFGNSSNRVWEQYDLVKYLKKKKAKGIFFENTVPFLYKKGVAVIHDVSLRVNTKLFSKSIKGMLSIVWRRIMYSSIMHSKMRIVTVSNFSKSEIAKYYHIDSETIGVVYNAWQHIDNIVPDMSVFYDRRIIPQKYYFAMASLAPNKNFNWIARTASKNPEEVFVIAGGGKIGEVIKKEYRGLKNLIYLGYVTDEVAKALMGNCKAFLFPSFYEGFGIPPLEAVASGCNSLILSDIPCLREVYGECGTYVNPKDDCLNIKEMTLSQLEKKEVLDKYSWSESAENLYKLLYI